MTRLTVYAIGLMLSIIVMSLSPLGSSLFTVSSGLTVGFTIPILDAIISNFAFLKIIGYSLRTWRQRVRISASYLYRIQLDNEYLLIKGERFEQFQPVGGVYKRHSSSFGELKNINILNDNLLLPDEISEGDLRIRVPGKHLVSFIRWFENEQGRETDCWREFYEELIATNMLPKEHFQVIKYDRIERRYEPMRFSKWANSHEILIADIVELLPTPEQTEALKQLRERSDERIQWATENQIRRLGVREGASNQKIRISETALWTIEASR